jgi:hypothetical protein
MKIDVTSIDREQFMVHEHILFGEVVYLVQPQHIGCKWTQSNKHFRSSVWNSEGELISAGFPKFTNWGENPEYFPVPTDLRKCTVMEKLDGSLLIVSKYKGEYILRTRGTVDASNLDNGYELEVFKNEVLPLLKERTEQLDTWVVSLLFEWLSPTNRIVLSYGDKPMFKFIGSVSHTDYSLWNQRLCDVFAEDNKLSRPEVYTFDSVDSLMSNVDQWKGKEGVVIYSKEGQQLHKVKSAWYLALHHMKSELASFDKVIDVWFTLGKPNYQDFYNHVAKTFDFELANQIQGDMSRICDGSKEVTKIVDGMIRFVDGVRSMPLRRDQAQKILSAYGETNRGSFCFKLLDNKPLADDDLKKLLYQVLK